MSIIIKLLILGVFIASVYNLYYHISIVRKNKNYISFKEAMELMELPVITFYVKDKKLHFLLDTGSNYSALNKNIIKTIEHKESEKKGQIYGIDGIIHEINYAEITLSYRDKKYQEEFQLIDLEDSFGRIKEEFGVTLHGIIGSAFMEKYKYVLDFKEMIAYSKK